MCFPKIQRIAVRENIAHWRNIGASDTVLKWIKDGIDIPFHTAPENFCLKNQVVSPSHHNFINEEIQRLLNQGAIIKCNNEAERPHCVSPINCVPKRNNKLRLVVDMRKLNTYCTVPSFQHEDINTVLDLVEPRDKLISVDIKDGYHHVYISEDSQKYLGIQWNGQFYKWAVLPFGLSASSYFFCKMVRPIVAHLRQQGLKTVSYVDDYLLTARADIIDSQIATLIHTFNTLGILINWEKSQLNPSTEIEFIGYIIRTESSDGQVWIEIPKRRITRLRHDIKLVLNKGVVSARGLARISGQCISMSKAILPAKLLLRNLYRLLRSRTSWQDKLILDLGTIKDLKWWMDALNSWNGSAAPRRVIDIQLTTDASQTGWGAFIGNQEAKGLWNLRISQKSSNYREMLAILLAVRTFAQQLKNKSLQILTDNISATAYINYQGGPSTELTQLAIAIWQDCIENNTSVTAKFLAGRENIHADFLSREISHHDWMLNPRLYQYLDKKWGPHTIDRCASLLTRQTTMYNSLFFDPETTGVDCLAQQDWHIHNNFVNPPFRIIPKILNIIQQQGATATLVAPRWPSKPWFQQLLRMSVSMPIRLPNSKKAFLSLGKVPEPLKNRKWKIFAWRLCGRTN